MYNSKYRSVPQIRPPFCNLSLSTKRRGGLYAGCDDFSRDYAPPPLPVPIKNDLIVGGDEGQARGGEMLLTLQLKSFNVQGQGRRALPRSSCMACPSLMRAVRVRSRHFNGRQPIGLGKYLILRYK